MMYFVRYQAATHELALIGAAMFALEATILWLQWKQ